MSPLRGGPESFPAVRLRLRVAVKGLAVERGCAGLELADVAERAGVDEEEVRSHFDSAAACLLDAYLAFTEDFDRCVFGAFDAGVGWRSSLRAAAYAAAGYVEDRPHEVRFGAIALLDAPPMVQAHRARHLQRLAQLVDRGREELGDPGSLGGSVAEAVIGAVNALIVKEFQRRSGRRPAEFVPELMYLAVRPYLGREIAREELTLPVPAPLEGGPGDGP